MPTRNVTSPPSKKKPARSRSKAIVASAGRTTALAGRVEAALKESASAELAKRLHALGLELARAVAARQEPEGSFELAVRAFEKAAKAGLPESYVELGRCLAHGYGVPQDVEGAVESYRKAAALGSSEGALLAAQLLFHRLNRYPEAHALALKAREGGDPRGEAHYLLGLMSYGGLGCKRELNASFKLLTAAAERGHADAQFELHGMLATGQGCQMDDALGRHWLARAAAQNHPRACYNMGAFAFAGNGVPRSVEEALRWYSRAAEAGHGQASATLGVLYLQGGDVPKNPVRARACLDRAEQQGFDVQGFLGRLGLSRPPLLA